MINVKLVSCSNPNNTCDLLEESYYNTFNGFDNSSGEISFYPITNQDDEPLSKIYNEQIDEEVDGFYDYIIFCHDDISLECANLPKKLEEAIGEDSPYAICGVAGATECSIKDKNLWHLMAPRDKLSGAVAHYTGKDDKECFMTHFGVMPQRCILLDGVFLAVNLKKINEVGLRFDEDCPSKFHFYDLLFCLQANKLGLKMTTWPIWLIHKSHGLSDIDNEEWNKGNEYFKKKWS